ncbi:uncharacterized protein LOC143888600 [Tasmannia lanceolata]|uniref:uncharacterized protein LOC143888600 n=1 Tax=Tasmannia lanceolata TaxID=3420 RepID=UPI004064288D
MVFGKRPRVEEDFSSIQEDNDDDSWMHEVDAQNLEDMDEGEDIDSQILKTSKPSNKQFDPQSKPLLDEVILIGAAQGKNPGGAKRKKAQIQWCSALLKNREEYERVRKKVHDAEKVGVSLSLKNSTLIRRHAPSIPGAIESAFGITERDAVDVKVLRALCANGIPFNVLRNPQFHEMVSAINRAPKGYKAPSFEKSRTTLLDEMKRNVKKEMHPVKDTCHGAMFLYAEDFEGIEKSGAAIAELLLKAIEEVGPTNVLQVVTDNAANCKLAGKEVEKVHKHIFWLPCVVHTLNLIFKDLAKGFEWFQNTYKRGKAIVKYFLNHTHKLAMFRAQSKLELLKVAKTRFASHYILLKRLIDCREALATTIVLKTWKDLVKNGDEHTRKMGALVAQTISIEDFLEDVDSILAIAKPIYFLIKFCDGDGPKMGEIYERMDNMLGEIKDFMKKGNHCDKYPKVEEIVLKRWEKMNIQMHCLRFALTPRFYDPRYLAMPAPGGTV